MQIIDVSKDPYGRRHYAYKKRQDFEKLKRTVEFQSWKRRQMRIQKERCAYCEVPLYNRNIVVHIDHIEPLYYEGSNNLDNLVLTCRRCNTKKWINNRVVKPKWVKENEELYPRVQQLSTVRGQQKKLMKELIKRQLDEEMAYQIKEWFKEE